MVLPGRLAAFIPGRPARTHTFIPARRGSRSARDSRWPAPQQGPVFLSFAWLWGCCCCHF